MRSLRWALVFLAAIIFLIAIPFRTDNDLVTILMTIAGGVLAFAGFIWASIDSRRVLTFEAISKLLDDEADPEQAKAKARVYAYLNPPGNPYEFVRNNLSNLVLSEREEVDKARRRITSFWYRAAQLVDLDVLTPDQIFKAVGPPDVVAALERLETVKAFDGQSKWQPHDWPPMKLLIIWNRKHGRGGKASQLKPQIPAQPELYSASLEKQAT